jgi:hypothetical protein
VIAESVTKNPAEREAYLLRALREMPDMEIYDRMPVGAQDAMRDLGKVAKRKDMGSLFFLCHVHSLICVLDDATGKLDRFEAGLAFLQETSLGLLELRALLELTDGSGTSSSWDGIHHLLSTEAQRDQGEFIDPTVLRVSRFQHWLVCRFNRLLDWCADLTGDDLDDSLEVFSKLLVSLAKRTRLEKYLAFNNVALKELLKRGAIREGGATQESKWRLQ